MRNIIIVGCNHRGSMGFCTRRGITLWSLEHSPRTLGRRRWRGFSRRSKPRWVRGASTPVPGQHFAMTLLRERAPHPAPVPPVPNPIQSSLHWRWGLRSGMSHSSQVSQLGVILSRPPVPPGYLGHLETFLVTSMRKGCRGHRVGRAWGAQGPAHRTSGPHICSAWASRPALQAPLTWVLLPRGCVDAVP